VLVGKNVCENGVLAFWRRPFASELAMRRFSCRAFENHPTLEVVVRSLSHPRGWARKFVMVVVSLGVQFVFRSGFEFCYVRARALVLTQLVFRDGGYILHRK
jgi:hypothetical protein